MTIKEELAMSNHSYGVCLLCGGKGTRLLSLTNNLLPKSLVQVDGKELIKFSLEGLDPLAVSHVVFAVDHQSEILRQWVLRQNLVFPFSFSEQVCPGVLSAIQSAMELMAGKTVIVCNTDEIRLRLQLQKALNFHEANQGIATMVVTNATHLNHHRVVEVDSDNLVRSTTLKDASYLAHPEMSGRVNTGVLVFESEAFAYGDQVYSTGWSGIIDPLVAAKQLRAYVDTDIVYFNVGTEAEYHEAARYLEQYPRNS